MLQWWLCRGLFPIFSLLGTGVGTWLFVRLCSFFAETCTYTNYTMRWSVEERAHAVEVYLRCNSPARALRALRREWGRERVPVRNTLISWARDFPRVGSVPGGHSVVPGVCVCGPVNGLE